MHKRKRKDHALRFLYHTRTGRTLLKPLTCRPVSKVSGRFLDSPMSKPLIRPFVRKNRIDLEDFYADDFRCFNDCFTRRIREPLRPIDRRPESFISPCDGLLSVYPVKGDTVLPVKQSRYTLSDLLEDEVLAARYRDGLCLVFRLCVDHYHRYCYLDDGTKGENRFLPGKLHTVRPVALAAGPVFTQNCRELTVMDTDNFGPVTQVEVGAMLVGKIHNHHGAGPIVRGEEKGMFLYGGSTVILLVEKDRVRLRGELLEASARGEEYPVQMGQLLGTKI
ncbi:MAG: phosphatidylserine decarboxylase [Clostridia bacterium]|nr:phosphatidylserine decarboxylase [Clostridia bacterium]